MSEVAGQGEDLDDGRLSASPPPEKLYGDAKEYWSKVPASVNGMLGDLGFVSRDDVKQSKQLLSRHLPGGYASREGRALDCGAGIGRTTRHLLLPIFTEVDMVDVNQAFLDEADNYIGNQGKVDMSRIRRFCTGLQDFFPEEGTYDLIWSQWVLGHLNDPDLITFFERCRKGLSPSGIMIIKENVASGVDKEFDETDSSWTRPKRDLCKAINKGGFIIIDEQKQQNFPTGLYDVFMFVCRRWEKKT